MIFGLIYGTESIYSIQYSILQYTYECNRTFVLPCQGGRLKLSTIIGNAYGKAKRAVSAFMGPRKRNKDTSITRSIYLTAAAFLKAQRRPVFLEWESWAASLQPY